MPLSVARAARGRAPGAATVPPGARAGSLLVALTDSPGLPNVTAVNVCIDRVDVVFDDGRPITSLAVSRTINLLDLRSGVTAALGIAQLPVGTIDQLRLILCPDGASAVIDGQMVPVKVPSGTQTGIKLTRPGGFVVSDSITTTVIVDFDAAASLHYAPGQGWMLTPVVQVLDVAILLAVTSPAAGAYVKPTFTVTGTVAAQAPLASLTVNGIAATITGVDFSADVTVAEGPATITVTATDAAGHRAVVTVPVTADGTPPALAIASPANGALVTSGSVTVSGTVSDSSPVTVTVQGSPATVSGGTFSAAGVPVGPGSTTIVAVATDAAGNTSSASVAVTPDLSSGAGVIGPAGGAVLAPPGPFTGTAIIVPPGALAGDVTVGFRVSQSAPPQADDFGPVGPVLELFTDPPGVTLHQPVVVRAIFSPPLASALRATTGTIRLMHAEATGGGWAVVPGAYVDWAAGRVEARLGAFSWVQAVTENPGSFVATLLAGCETGCLDPGANGTATAIPLGVPTHTAVAADGTVYFIERPIDGSASLLRKVTQSATGPDLSTLEVAESAQFPGQFNGLAMEDGSMLLLSTLPGYLTAAMSHVDRLDLSVDPPVVVGSQFLGDYLASGLAKDPASSSIYFSVPGVLGHPEQSCLIMRAPFGGTPMVVAGKAGSGCGDNSADNPDPSDPATNTDPSAGPAYGTNVQLDLPYEVSLHPLSSGGNDLLFITDTNNRRVLALNISSGPVTIGGASLPAGCLVTIAGSRDAATPPGGDIGNAPLMLNLCGPGAVTMADSVLAFTDVCGTSKGAALLSELQFPGTTMSTATARLTADYRTFTSGTFEGSQVTSGRLMLGPATGLAFGGPTADRAFYVADAGLRALYKIHQLPPPTPPTCTRKSCADLGANCGVAPDGCGGQTTNCGSCTGTDNCGGSGTPNVCGNAWACDPVTSCAALAVQCGIFSNRCDGILDCGNDDTCVDGCLPQTHDQLCPGLCGWVPDGCGGVVDCGGCSTTGTESTYCGGGGYANTCGNGWGCSPYHTCADAGAECGVVSDGCWGVLECGGCGPGLVCDPVYNTCGCGPLDCNDFVDCTTDTCTAQGCQHTVPADGGYCAIGRACVAKDTTNPANQCEVCDPGHESWGWSPKPADSGCFDGDLCTHGDHCVGSTCVPGAVDVCNCQKKDCAAGQCGWVDDGCGGLHWCQEAATCTDGKCWVTDGCGEKQACGPCQGSTTCDQQTGDCVACTPDLDQDICDREGQTCGEVFGWDLGCDVERLATCRPCTDAEREYILPPQDPSELVTTAGGATLVVDHVLITLVEVPGYTPADYQQEAEEVAASVGGTRIGQMPSMLFYQLQVPATTHAQLESIIDTLKLDSRVDTATYNLVATPAAAPQCPPPSDLDQLDRHQRCPYAQLDYHPALTVMDYFRSNPKVSSAPVRVGILDTGLNRTGCADWVGVQVEEYGIVTDYDGHGTAVASVIAAANNDPPSGTNGVASRFLGNRLILQVARVQLVTTPTADRLAEALWLFSYLVARGARVVNMSGGADFGTIYPSPPTPSEFAIEQSRANDARKLWVSALAQRPRALLVVAASNDSKAVSRNSLDVPAGTLTAQAQNILTVGGTTSCQSGLPVAVSAYGAGVDIYAPAVRIAVSSPVPLENRCTTEVYSGTSFATPLVTSLAAILVGINPKLTGADLRSRILSSGSKTNQGFPRLNLLNPIGAELLALNDGKIAEKLDPYHSGSFSAPWLAAPLICDTGMDFTIKDYGEVRHEARIIIDQNGDRVLGAGGSAAGPLQFTLGGSTEGTDHGTEVLCPSCQLRMDQSYGLVLDAAQAAGTASLAYGASLPPPSVGGTSLDGSLEFVDCRIEWREHATGDYPVMISVEGAFGGSFRWSDNPNYFKWKEFYGTFSLPVGLGNFSPPDFDYFENNCVGGIPRSP